MSNWPNMRVCESTAPLTLHRQLLLWLARAHAGLIGHLPAALAASASPAPTPCEPSWKAASFMAGGAGGWAWEAPRVSRRVPLPQPLPAPAAQWGHHLSSHTCAMGLCTRKHILFLSLSCSNTHAQAYTPILKQSHCTKESKHKPTGSHHTNSQTQSYTLTRKHPCWCPKLHTSTPTHTRVHVQGPHAQMQTHPCADLHASNCSRSYTNTRSACGDTVTGAHTYRQARSWKLATEPHSHVLSPSESHTLWLRHERLDPTTVNEF